VKEMTDVECQEMSLPSFFIFSLRLFTYIVWFGRMSIIVAPSALSENWTT
jgi:hypothetical protein